ncbi:hypothetical protein MRX96_055182 [Rhipicephalus microplus]
MDCGDLDEEVFLECAMAVDASGDSAGRADRTSARRRNASTSGGGDAAPSDVLLLDDTPVGTPCSDFLAIDIRLIAMPGRAVTSRTFVCSQMEDWNRRSIDERPGCDNGDTALKCRPQPALYWMSSTTVVDCEARVCMLQM